MLSSRGWNQITVTIRPKSNSNSVNHTVSYIWDSLTTFWAPPKGLGHFPGSTLCNTHALSSRLRLAPVHDHCRSCWSFHGTGIFKMLESSTETGQHFPHNLSCALFMVQSFNFLHDLFSPGVSTATGAVPSPLPCLGLAPVPSLSCSARLLHAVKTCAIWGTLTP